MQSPPRTRHPFSVLAMDGGAEKMAGIDVWAILSSGNDRSFKIK